MNNMYSLHMRGIDDDIILQIRSKKLYKNIICINMDVIYVSQNIHLHTTHV